MSDVIAADQLRLFIERAERLKEEIKNLQDDLKGVFSEAKGQGFSPPIMKEIIKLRAMDINERREREALIDTYRAALGMLDGTPLGTWAVERLTKKRPPEDAAAAAQTGDAAFEAAKALVIAKRKSSTSWLQRQLGIGYNEAARLIELLQDAGIVSAPDHVGKREVLAPAPEGAEDIHEEEEADEPAAPEPTLEDARRMGGEAARAGQPVTSNPFPARDPKRAAWDEAWCRELGSDGMDIPEALKPTLKPKKGPGAPGAGDDDDAPDGGAA